jgi:hypothetical protein
VSAISAPSRYEKSRAPETGAVSVYDVGDCIRSWGRRGIFLGAILGFILGAIFVAIPLTTDTLTFGVAGTLLVAAVECAAVAGGLGVLAAALYGRGVRRNSATEFHRALSTGRQGGDILPSE